MSRAFVREWDTDTVVVLPDRPVSEHPNNVTEAGMAQIETAIAEARAETGREHPAPHPLVFPDTPSRRALEAG